MIVLKTQNKMQEYLDNGIRLGWLIDSKNQRVEITDKARIRKCFSPRHFVRRRRVDRVRVGFERYSLSGQKIAGLG